tara:strand:- start:9632 stop:10306 length:675 start_codon:yes stop_codon:yes gene_type:complete
MKTEFETWMIVFCEDKNRVKYYNQINKQIRTNLFSAIDSIHYYDKWANLALSKDYCTIYYKKQCDSKKGKMGCNLSHQMLLETVLNESKSNWNLILEDDVSINVDKFLKDVNIILKTADDNNSLFIQLYTHPKFHQLQIKQTCLYENLYKMTFQWGTCGYFIHKKAINDFVKSYPLCENIDIEFGKKISRWKSLCWLNNGIVTEGAIDVNDNKSKLGSIIYKNS